MKFSFNNAIAASLHLTSLSSQSNQLAAFSSSSTFSTNNKNNNNNSNDVKHSASLNNVQALSTVPYSSSSTFTALQMSVSDEERVNHFHHQHYYDSGSNSSNGAEDEGEELSLISALVESNGYHPANGNSNNGHHQPQHYNGEMKNSFNGNSNGQSSATTATATTAPIIDSNGVQYKLTNGQASPSTKSNGATQNGKQQHSNGHTEPRNGNNDDDSSIPQSTIESIVEQRVMKEVELQAQELAEHEVELADAQQQQGQVQALEQKLQQGGNQNDSENNNGNGIELQVEQFNAGNTDYKSSSSRYFDQGHTATGDVGRRGTGVALPEDNPLAMHIIQNTTVGGVGGLGRQLLQQDQPSEEGATTAATDAAASTAPEGTGVVVKPENPNDGITLDSFIETTKLAPTRLTSKELKSMEKIKEDEVVNNQAFHQALEQKVVTVVESATERIAEQCTMNTTPAEEDNGSNGVTDLSTPTSSDDDGDATTVAAATTAAVATVEVKDTLDATNLERKKLSTATVSEPQVKEQVDTASTSSKSQENVKPFSPLPKVKALPKNGQYLDALSSNTPKSKKRRGKKGFNGPNVYLSELDGKNVKSISGSGVGGYLDEITVQKNLNRGRFRIPFVGRLWNRNNHGNDRGEDSKDDVDDEIESKIEIVEPPQEEEEIVELKSEKEEDSILEVTEEAKAEEMPEVDDGSSLEVPKVKISFDVTADIPLAVTEEEDVLKEEEENELDSEVNSYIHTADIPLAVTEVEDDLKEEKENELDSEVNSYIHTNSSKIKVLTNTASQGNYLSYLELKTKEEQIAEKQSEESTDLEEVAAATAAGNNYLESLSDKESTATLSGNGPSNYLSQLETQQNGTEKRNMKNVRIKLRKVSNIVALFCLLEMKKPILKYALPAGGIATAANVISSKNPLLSFTGTLGFAMMYAGSSVGQLLPYGGVLKQAVSIVGCSLLLTSNYFSRRSENKKK